MIGRSAQCFLPSSLRNGENLSSKMELRSSYRIKRGPVSCILLEPPKSQVREKSNLPVVMLDQLDMIIAS